MPPDCSFEHSGSQISSYLCTTEKNQHVYYRIYWNLPARNSHLRDFYPSPIWLEIEDRWASHPQKMLSRSFHSSGQKWVFQYIKRYYLGCPPSQSQSPPGLWTIFSRESQPKPSFATSQHPARGATPKVLRCTKNRSSGGDKASGLGEWTFRIATRQVQELPIDTNGFSRHLWTSFGPQWLHPFHPGCWNSIWEMDGNGLLGS